jgi:flavin reductase (DIM6/NTAB) family NADH-FMN oxidoreductase RutF
VNVLAAGQADIAAHFAGQSAASPHWMDGVAAPVLVGNAATISCRPWRTYDGGDHLLVLGEVTHLEIGDAEPLLFFGGRFREIRPRQAGEHWAASVDCPDLGWYGTAAEFAPTTKGSQ